MQHTDDADLVTSAGGERPLGFSDAAPALRAKLLRVVDAVGSIPSAVVAFSAGVDSTCVLALAVRVLGCERVVAAVGVSPSLPERELAEARELAGRLGVELVEVATCEMEDPRYVRNGPDRCFWCKTELFTRLTELAHSRGLAAVLCGNNADDAGDYRPGLEAGRKLGVRSPLMDAGLTKADVREVLRLLGLETWRKPAMACLASRLPYETAVTPERLGRVERAESALRDLGFPACRVRDHGPVARIEVPPGRMDDLLAARQRVVDALKQAGYAYVAMDLAGYRTGSMNEVLRRE